MDRIEELTIQLREAILESEEYREFKRMEEVVNRFPDLKRAVDDFRRENFFFQYSDDAGDVLRATESLSNRFADVRKQPYVEQYLSAEMGVCRMVDKILTDITDVVDFNMDFLYDDFN